MPRRRPRAVYEVYDAAEALGDEHELPAFGDEPVDPAPDPAVVRAARAAGRGPAHIASERPERWAPGRMLAGVLLCVVAVCALVAIGIALAHVLGGAGVGRRAGDASSRGPSGVPGEASAPLGSHGRARAPVERAEAVKRLEPATRLEPASRLEPATPTEAVESARRGRRAPAAGPIHRGDPAGLPPAGPDVSPEPQTPWAPPAPSLGCACAAAEVEFGFER